MTDSDTEREKYARDEQPSDDAGRNVTRRAVVGGIAGGILGVTLMEQGPKLLSLGRDQNPNLYLSNSAAAQSDCLPDPTSTPNPTATSVPTSTAVPTSTPSPTPTPQPTPTPTPTPPPSQILVRRDLHSLAANGPQMQAFAQGVAAMRQRPASNPTSWQFQASIHPSNCQHNTLHFVSWHRMYIYFFERILREASGDPSFTLPYWNYFPTNQRILPAPFRDPANPLYVAQRSWAVRSGQQPAADQNYRFDHTPAFAVTNFTHTGNGTSFGGRVGARGLLEGAPHNTVHTWIGGFMSTLEEAGLDPIFWCHHSNLDRLWGNWLLQGGGRANPASGVFLDTNFTFYDVGGNAVVMRGSQILSTVSQLNYRYDDQTQLSSQAIGPRRPSRPVKFKDVGAKNTAKLRLGKRPVTLAIPIRRQAAKGRGTLGRRRSRASLTLSGVTGGGVPGVGFEVHVNATSPNPGPRAKSFVGPVGLFGLQPNDRPGHGPHAASISFDITKAVNNIGASRSVKVTLVPVDMTDSGTLPEGTYATIQRMVISMAQPASASGNQKRRRKANPKTARPRGEQRKQRPQPARPKKQREGTRKRRRTVNQKPKGPSNSNPKPAGKDKRSQAPGDNLAVQAPVTTSRVFSFDPLVEEPTELGHVGH